jgi:parallel beta helix pectate lyase-like protein
MHSLLTVIALFLTGLIFLTPGHARADDCANIGGSIVGTECQIDNNAGSLSGTFNLDETLHILSGGKITVPSANGGNTLTINVCALPAVCDFIMDTGAQIRGDVTGTDASTGVGATINISATRNILLHGSGGHGALISSNQKAGSCTQQTVNGVVKGGKGGNINLVAGGNITTEAGSVISADGTPCPAGAISLIAAQGSVLVAGLVESVSTLSGTGGSQRPGGGPISIIARCDLTIEGTVQSKGGDPGADLVHLEGGCRVVINGLVESTGDGHVIPNSPPNHCNSSNRPDKPTNSTGCIEVWAGDSLTINPTAEINADTGSSGGNDGTGWIDLFCRGPITITGPTSTPFAVHANGLGGSGGVGEFGGLVTVKSAAGTVTASGLALQASVGSGSNSHGGQITVAAAANVTLDTAHIEAKSPGTGGAIQVRSFTGALSWQNGVGDVRTNTTGTIDLAACSAPIKTTGTNFNGEVPSITTGVCTPPPPDFLPAYVVLPTCICGVPGTGAECPEDLRRIVTRTVDPTGTAHGFVPNHLTLGEAVQNASSSESIGMFGNTTENVSIPTKTLLITQCTLARITAADNGKPVVDISSPDPITIISLDTVGGTVGWLIESSNHDLKSLRATGASSYGILVTGNSNSVSWNEITSCTVAGIRVEGNLNDLRGGTVDLNPGDGVQLGTTAAGNTFQGATVQQNGGNGIVVDGSGNSVLSNSRVDNNTLNGIAVTGNGNIIKGNSTGSGAGKGNGEDGINVTGRGNTLDSNKSSANGGDGLDVSGGTAAEPNALRGNQSNLDKPGGKRENVGAEFRLLGTIKGLGGNKADGKSVPSSSKCRGFPPSKRTATFLNPFVCE